MSPQTIRTPRSPRNSVEDPAVASKASLFRTNTSRWVGVGVGGKAPCRAQRFPSQSGRKGYQYQHNPNSWFHLRNLQIFIREKSSIHKNGGLKKNKHVFFCFHVWLMRWIGEMYIVMKYPEFHCNIFYTCLYVLVEWISGSHHETFMTSDWHTFKHLHWLATWPNHDPDKSTNPKSRPNLSTHNLDSIWIHQSIISRKFHDIRTRTSRGRKFPVYKKNINL